MADNRPKAEGAQRFNELFAELRDRLDDLATFDGTQNTKAIVKLQELVNDLPGQIFAILATTVNTGSVNATGNVSAGGSVSAASLFATSVFAANAGNVAGNITAPRTTTWARNSDGYIGNTLSSIRFKTNVEDANIDPLAILSINVKHYEYIAEVRKRDDPTFAEYVGPDYHVAREVGAIAEELHAAGLWQFVIYERDSILVDGPPDDRGQSEEEFYPPTRIDNVLRLDENGEPIPLSIHYELWALGVQVATQHVWNEHLALVELQKQDRADIDRILTQLAL